jgi:hypothetical protein
VYAGCAPVLVFKIAVAAPEGIFGFSLMPFSVFITQHREESTHFAGRDVSNSALHSDQRLQR